MLMKLTPCLAFPPKSAALQSITFLIQQNDDFEEKYKAQE